MSFCCWFISKPLQVEIRSCLVVRMNAQKDITVLLISHYNLPMALHSYPTLPNASHVQLTVRLVLHNLTTARDVGTLSAYTKEDA